MIPSPSLPVSPLLLPASPTISFGYIAADDPAREPRHHLPSHYTTTNHLFHLVTEHQPYVDTSTPTNTTTTLHHIPCLPPSNTVPILLADREACLPGLKTGYALRWFKDKRRARDLYLLPCITDTWDEMLVGMPRAPATDEIELGRRDRCAHARTARLMEIKARISREAWGRSMDASDLACTEVMTLRTQVVAQWSEIAELWAADRRRQTRLTERPEIDEDTTDIVDSTSESTGPL
ncbi:hypothetical protein Tco_0984662 [Tanacetum coccineum]